MVKKKKEKLSLGKTPQSTLAAAPQTVTQTIQQPIAQPKTPQSMLSAAPQTVAQPKTPQSVLNAAAQMATSNPQPPKPTVNTGAPSASPQYVIPDREPVFNTPAVPSGSYDSASAYAQLQGIQDPSEEYNRQLMDIYNTYVDREAFSYDPAQDALYRQYRDQYLTQGYDAMLDAMGQAAALTGGYGNTYAQGVGQQAYNGYLQKLGAVMPELYDLAYDRYQDEGQQILNQYSMMQGMADDAYGRYQDQLQNGWQHVQYQQGREDEEYDRQVQAEQTEYDRQQDEYDRQQAEEQQEYDRQQDEYDRQQAEEQQEYDRQQDEYDRQQAEEQNAYDREQDEYDRQQQEAETAYDRQQDAYDQLVDLIAAGHRPTPEELEAAGMTQEQADALLSFHGYSVGGSSDTPSYSGGTSGVSADNIRIIQQALGIDADGIWGPASTEASGGLTAWEAWDKLQNGTWGTNRAQKFFRDKGTREQWRARGVTDKEYDAMVKQWLATCGFQPAEIRWLKQMFK